MCSVCSFSAIFLLIIGVTALEYIAPGLGSFEQFSSETLAYLQTFDHFEDAVRGMIDLRPLIYYFSTTALVLALSSLIVEAKS